MKPRNAIFTPTGFAEHCWGWFDMDHRQHVPTDQTAPELLPCPFCGSTNIDPEFSLTHQADGKKTRAPGCTSCGATADDPDAWNRRADLAAPSAPAEVGETWLERWRHLSHPNSHKMVSHPDGAWVRHHEASEAITSLQAEIERLRRDQRFIIDERDRTFALVLARAEAAEAELSLSKNLSDSAVKWAALDRDAYHRISMGGWSDKKQEVELAEALEELQDAAHAKLKGDV